jgi:hypothetical protein
MKETKKLIIRLAAVFYVSALATIGAGSLFGVPAATAAGNRRAFGSCQGR